MNPPVKPPTFATSTDEDLAEQARPGHGVPSQDPDPAAQTLLAPAEAAREAKSVLTGGGMVAGAAAGATLGVVAGGPVGVVVGAALGAVAGTVAAAAAGSAAAPPATDANPAPAPATQRSAPNKKSIDLGP
jgi:non-heme chloroperoxidase